MYARLIGGLHLVSEGGVDVTPRARKAAAIVGYLLLSGGPVARRERLASLLWSEKSESQARDSLRQCLVELRRSGIADQFITITARDVAVVAQTVATDVALIDAALQRGDLEAAIDHLSGDDLSLLSGYDDLDPAFADWLTVERERWSQALVADLLQVIHRDGRSKQILHLVEAVLRLDPYQEEAVHLTMERLAMEESAAAALGFFQRYQRALQRDYDVEPSPELVALARRLRSQATVTGLQRPSVAETGAATATTVPKRSAPRSDAAPPRIAVVVDRASADAGDLAAIADAFRHDLIATLSRFKEWTVITPPDTDPADGAPYLIDRKIDYLLYGRLLTDTGAPVIDISLKERSTNECVLEERHDASAERWIAILNGICRKVGAHLQRTIATSRLRQVEALSPHQRSAYDLWLEGYLLSMLWRREADDQAEKLFERAIELDPSLGCAYSSLAGILHTRHLVSPGWPAIAQDRERALVLARKAVELDRLDCRNHVMLGWAHTLAERFDSADFHFRLAVDLNPSNPNVVVAAGSGAVFSGDHDEAFELIKRAFELNPIPVDYYFAYRAQMSFFRRDFHGCIEDVLRKPNILPSIRMWAAAAFVQLNVPDLAREELESCYAEVRARWAGPAPPTDSELHRYLQTLYGFRREDDRAMFVASLDAAARRADTTRPATDSRSVPKPPGAAGRDIS